MVVGRGKRKIRERSLQLRVTECEGERFNRDVMISLYLLIHLVFAENQAGTSRREAVGDHRGNGCFSCMFGSRGWQCFINTLCALH